MQIQASELRKLVALSTAEAEYYLASLGAVEVIYLRQLLLDMGFGPTSPTLVYEDNTALMEWAKNVIDGRQRAKHLDIRKHFAHEAAASCTARTSSSQRVSTTDQLANVFTKSLQPAQFAIIIAGRLLRTWPGS